jgi:hypothetical protein
MGINYTPPKDPLGLTGGGWTWIEIGMALLVVGWFGFFLWGMFNG